MLSKHKPHIDWFRDAAPYINAHRGKTIVIAISGDAIIDDTIERFIHDIALLHFLGSKVILVHGSRTQIQQQLKIQNIESEFHRNIRITTKDALSSVIHAATLITANITSLLSTGLPNTPMSGASITVSSGNYISAMPLGVLDGVDMQHSGKVRDVHCNAINQLLEQQHLVVLSNIGYSKSGEIFNLSMAEVATQTAVKLKADKLIFMTDSGFYQPKNSFNSGFEVRDWMQNQTLSQHDSDIMSHAALAVDQEINRVHLIDRQVDGALLLELFTREGCGCLISKQNYQGLRAAQSTDIVGIFELIQPLVASGKLVARSKEQLEVDIKNFSVIEVDGLIAACSACIKHTNSEAEFACLAVHDEFQNNGFASRLLHYTEQSAKASGINTLFSLSTQAEHWFLDNGFVRGDLSSIPTTKQLNVASDRRSKVLLKKLQ